MSVAIGMDTLKPEFRKKFVVDLKGKSFVTYNGLMFLGKEKGIKSLTSRILQYPNAENNNTCIIEATIVGSEIVNGEVIEVTYAGIGDANPSNCNKMVGQHFVRMAETRAKGRVLRDFLGIDMVMDDELGGEAFESNDPQVKKCTKTQMDKVGSIMRMAAISKEQMQEIAKETCGSSDMKSYTFAMAEHLIKVLSDKFQITA